MPWATGPISRMALHVPVGTSAQLRSMSEIEGSSSRPRRAETVRAGGATTPRVVLTGGAAAFPIRDFLTRANVAFDYRDGEGPIGIAVCTLPDGRRLEAPT